MTGICGLWYRDGRAAAQGCIRMRHALQIYGPHRAGQWDGGEISFGIQLFRMLPEDRADRQPLIDRTGRFVLLADVRLDNRPELAAELGWSNDRARDAADADYVLAAWEKWRDAGFDKLIGDWAIAVWDGQKHTITLARDMMGARPLFYHTGNGFFAFSSMAKGLHALADIPLAPDLDTLRDYLALAPRRGPGSFFKDVARVEQGGKVVLYADGRVDAGHWYDWACIKEREVTDDAECIAEFRAIFDRAVADRLRSTGPIASHLSSGFDSTAVTTTAAILLAAKGKRLTAFTHVPTLGWQQEEPKGRSGDEGAVAAATAARFTNIDHVRVDSGARMIGQDLNAAFYYSEWPVLNPCNYVWEAEIKRRAKGHGVLLTGVRGNMTIGRDGRQRLHQLMRARRFGTWAREVWLLVRGRKMGLLGILHQSFGPWLPPRMQSAVLKAFGRTTSRLSDYSALNPAIVEDGHFRHHLEVLGCDPTFSPRAHMRGVSEYVLKRNDHNSLHAKGILAEHGLDLRDPAGDRRLVEFSLSLPSSMWLRDGEMKWLYRQAFRDRVPAAVMSLTHKGYQGADWPERFRCSKSLLDAEIQYALASPSVQVLMDGHFLKGITVAILPVKMAASAVRMYRIKYLRGLSVAHFIRKAEGHN